ncbi:MULTISPECIES: DUF4238 domain-containing protein [Paenibacillus]|uniref:DUF4238 domain-containing protein n=1 Tax=Paenibacillus TaxID=44249 RepID=UPI0022B8F03E|nr:DUF4238 domain-containing protein [Paenibacillus caseinilyticus]
MAETVKNQHYVPQCVLCHFSNDKQVYETLVEGKKIYKTNYNRSMSERYTYEHPLLEQNKLEKFFGDVESDFAPAIKKIVEILENQDEDEVNQIQNVKQTIDLYLRAVIIFYYRSGALLHEFSLGNMREKDLRIDYLLEKLSNGSYINALGKTIKKYYEFTIIKSENNEFLLSDQYLSTAALSIKSRFLNISNRHIGLNDVFILIPISCKYYAVYYHGKKPNYIQKNKINVLTEHQVDEINKVIINNSYVKCVGYSKESLERVLLTFKSQSPASTYTQYKSGALGGATLKKEVFFYEKDQIAWEMFTEGTFFVNFKDLERNDPCGCKSGKKLKKCCIEPFSIIKGFLGTFSDEKIHEKIRPHPKAVTEYSVTEFFSKETR